MIRVVLAAALSVLFSQAVFAGPVFSLVGGSPLTAPHPTGEGGRVASGSWGISGTGGGFLDGTIIFSDSFLLPGDGETISINAGDIDRLDYRHVESAFVGGGAINPSFAFSAETADIESAVGTVRNLGGGAFDLVGVSVQTTVAGALFRILPGFLHVVEGDYLVSGDTVGFRVDSYSGVAQPPGTLAMVIVNGQYPGGWRMTGTTTAPVPLPPGVLLFMSGLLILVLTGTASRVRQGQTAR